MYKKDKICFCGIFATILVISWILDLAYRKILSDTITVVSIAIAVYLTAVTLLIGSKTAAIMRKQDKQIPEKTKLGVLVSYLNCAVIVGILSIVISCILLLSENMATVSHDIVRVISSFGCSLFVITLLFMWKIFRFIAEALLRE